MHDRDAILERMESLVNEINRHNMLYYTLDEPELTDQQYDELYDRLVTLEQETGIILPYSPTQRVGGELLEGFSEHRHVSRL